MIFTNFLLTSIYSLCNLFVLSIFITCLIAIAVANAYTPRRYIHERPYIPFYAPTCPNHHVHWHPNEPAHIHHRREHDGFSNVHGRAW